MDQKEKDILKFIGGQFERCNIRIDDANQLLFEVTHMYDYEDKESLRSSRLLELAQKYGFNEFEIYDDISWSGCETCDYGSRYGKAIRFWDKL